MQILRSTSALRGWVGAHRCKGDRIGFVPTMGNLHAGHFSLIAEARRRADVAIASVFVNPTQFGPGEDFERYPRTLDADADGLVAADCAALFLPSLDEVYPFGLAASVRIHVPGISDVLEGPIRPGHFDGVATVVAKLLNLVQPDLAMFGQKDFQQLQLIQRMVADLALPIEIVGSATVREANGLAMSSRNQYLSSEQCKQAGAIHATLNWMREQFAAHEPAAVARIEAGARERLEQEGFDVDYAVVRPVDDLASTESANGRDLIALIAARLAGTRLIDNLIFATG